MAVQALAPHGAVAVISIAKSLLIGCSWIVVNACSVSSPTSVNDPKAAIEAARQSWLQIYEKTHVAAYGAESTKKFEPYTAELKDGCWIVRGTVAHGYQGETLKTTVRHSDGSVSVKVINVD